ncbi:MAG: hypothetical protein WBH31_11200 [Promethearchaeia archaeon]
MIDGEIKLIIHKRSSCGKCGYTIFKRKGTKGAKRVATKRTPRRRMKSQ